MGTRGPVPKRSDQRRRANKPETPIVKATSPARSAARPKPDAHWHPIARDLYVSLADSGQAQFYEPSDWAKARLAAELTSRALAHAKPPGQLLAVVDSMWSSLLATEGDRRRLRVELERPKGGDEEAGDVSWFDDARRRLRAAD